MKARSSRRQCRRNRSASGWRCHAVRIPVDRLLDHIPIVHHNTRTIARLEQIGAANLASVTVGDDDVLYLRGVKAELFDPSDQYILGVIDTLGVVEDVAVIGG